MWDEPPCTSMSQFTFVYFDVHQGARLGVHSHLSICSRLGLDLEVEENAETELNSIHGS